jgi:hypothetical protein
MRSVQWIVGVGAATLGLVLGGASAASGSTIPDGPVEDGTDLGRCLVRLTGAGASGQETAVWGGVADILPDGNGEVSTGGRMWVYDPEDRYEEALAVVEDAAATCDEIILNGFSNGAAFAAVMYCRGENFGGRLRRVVLDDPLPDQGVVGCDPEPSVGVALYWTGALAGEFGPGVDCTGLEATCLGGTLLSIDDYAAALGVAVQPSIHSDHQWYWNAPELGDWSTADPGSAAASVPPATSA